MELILSIDLWMNQFTCNSVTICECLSTSILNYLIKGECFSDN